jgi:DNA-binding IclR family transcriptional regulator
MAMKATAQQISPEEYILAALSPQERVEAAFRIAQEAFKNTTLTLDDIEAAVRKVRRRLYAQRQKKAKDSD